MLTYMYLMYPQSLLGHPSPFLFALTNELDGKKDGWGYTNTIQYNTIQYEGPEYFEGRYTGARQVQWLSSRVINGGLRASRSSGWN
jgi:hypothetical protein